MSGETAVIDRSAWLSTCGQYRYSLTRLWGDGDTALWVMLNPSTADADVDDPTIRRCMAFTRSWGLDGMTVVNVFALRATDPRELTGHPDPVGPANRDAVLAAFDQAAVTVAAWGQSWPKAYAMTVHRMAKLLAGRAHHLGLTQSGQPMHPLYRPAKSPLLPFRALGDGA
jgi:hypothetical protein